MANKKGKNKKHKMVITTLPCRSCKEEPPVQGLAQCVYCGAPAVAMVEWIEGED